MTGEMRLYLCVCHDINCCCIVVHKHPLKEVEISAIIHGALSVRASLQCI